MSKKTSQTGDSRSPAPDPERKKQEERDSKLIAVSQKRALNAREIRDLLWVNPKTGKRDHFEEYCAVHREAYQQHYGTADFKEMLLKDLDGRFQEIQDLLYFKDLEEALMTKIEKRIDETSSAFRTHLKKALGKEANLRIKVRVLNKIRKTERRDILEGNVQVTEKAIKSYMELVREELKLQLQQLVRLEGEKGTKTERQRELMRTLYDKMDDVFDFIGSNLENDEIGTKRAYLKAFMLRKFRSEGGFAAVKKWYEELQENLASGNMAKSRTAISAMAQRLEGEAESKKMEHLRELMSDFTPDLSFTDEELQELFGYGDMRRGGASYDQRMAYHLEEIETRRFNIAMNKLTPVLDRDALGEQKNAIVERSAQLRNDLQDFREQKYNIAYVLEHHLEGKMEPEVRKRLIKATEALQLARSLKPQRKGVRSVPEEKKLMKEILALENVEQVAGYIANAEDEVTRSLVRHGGFKKSSLERMKLNAKSFDVFELLRERFVGDIAIEEQRRAPVGKSFVEFSKKLDLKEDASFETANDAIAAIYGYHYTRGFDLDSIQKYIRAINNSQFSAEHLGMVYEKFGDVLLRSKDKAVADLVEKLGFKRAKSARLPKGEEGLEVSIDLESKKTKAPKPAKAEFPKSSTPSDLAVSQILNISQHFAGMEDEEKEAEERSSSDLKNTLEMEAGVPEESDEWSLSREHSKRDLSQIDDEGLHRAEKRNLNKNLDREMILSGPPLEEIQKHLRVMAEIVDRKFARPKDSAEFARLEKDVRYIISCHHYVDHSEVLRDEDGRPLTSGGDHLYHQIKKEKALPFREQCELDSLLIQKVHLTRYERARESLMEGKDFNTESGLREGLQALYADFGGISSEKFKEVKKLTKVMSLDHPITAIRFNAAKRKPFVTNDQYQIHRLHGMPATYQDRAKALLEKARQLITDGNYADLNALFAPTGMADRLYLDAIFFPLNSIRDAGLRDEIVYDTVINPVTKKVDERRLSTKIPSGGRDLFAPFANQETNEYKQLDERYKKDEDLGGLKGGSLVDDEEGFLAALEGLPHEDVQMLQRYQDALIFHEDGTVSIDPSKFDTVSGRVFGVASVSEHDQKKMKPEDILKIAEKYPLIAARAGQFNSEALGYALGGLQYGGRRLVNVGRLPMQAVQAWWPNFKKSLMPSGLFAYTPMSIWLAIWEAKEHLANLYEFNQKYRSYTLLAQFFGGTLIGSEFEKLQQSKENERVDDFKKAFDQYGNDAVMQKLTTARDRFEFKQAMIQAFQERGLATNEDVCNKPFIETLNKFHPNYYVTAHRKYDDDQLKYDPDAQAEVLDQIRISLDKFWGGGTWQQWKNACVGKYESTQKHSYDNFQMYGGGNIRENFYGKYWKDLQSTDGINKLKALHPAEIVGNIENDLEVGHLNSGPSFAILQAMLCAGVLKNEHLKRLENRNHHLNNLPFMVFLEPWEAKEAGLTDIYEQCKMLDFDADKNPFVGFYEGKTALKLKGYREHGKWYFPKNEAEKKGKAKNNIPAEEVVITAHQLQRRRQAQPEWFKKMDNNSIGLFTPAYNWGEIQNCLAPDVNGDIQARPHDQCAAYRGIQHEFTGYIAAMADTSNEAMNDPTNFKRAIYYAYAAMSKTCAFAGFFGRHKNRKNDYNFNSDGSPIFDRDKRHTETKQQSGQTNFFKHIIDISGHNQRNLESAGTLDKMSDEVISPQLRAAYKMVAGHQYIKEIGVNPKTGKRDHASYVPYDIWKFDPVAEYRKALPLLMKDAVRLAYRRSKALGDEIKQSLEKSGLADFDITNTDREKKTEHWKVEEARLP